MWFLPSWTLLSRERKTLNICQKLHEDRHHSHLGPQCPSSPPLTTLNVFQCLKQLSLPPPTQGLAQGCINMGGRPNLARGSWLAAPHCTPGHTSYLSSHILISSISFSGYYLLKLIPLHSSSNSPAAWLGPTVHSAILLSLHCSSPPCALFPPHPAWPPSYRSFLAWLCLCST